MTIAGVRTTLTIDDDVLIAAKDRAVREKRTVGEVLSEVARAELTRRDLMPLASGTARHGFCPLPRRGPSVTNTLVDALRDGNVA